MEHSDFWNDVSGAIVKMAILKNGGDDNGKKPWPLLFSMSDNWPIKERKQEPRDTIGSAFLEMIIIVWGKHPTWSYTKNEREKKEN